MSTNNQQQNNNQENEIESKIMDQVTKNKTYLNH